MRRSGTGTSVVERREMETFQQVIIKISAESIIGTFRLNIGNGGSRNRNISSETFHAQNLIDLFGYRFPFCLVNRRVQYFELSHAGDLRHVVILHGRACAI